MAGCLNTVRLILATAAGDLTADEVKIVIAQAVAQAEASGLKAVIAVSDKEGNVLGVFNMTGAPAETVIGSGKSCAPCGLEGARVPTAFTAVSKAGTGAFLSSQGHAFPPAPQASSCRSTFLRGSISLLADLCSAFSSRSFFAVISTRSWASDYRPIPEECRCIRTALLVGGVGVEGDGRYGLDPEPTDKDIPVEELVAIAATRGFENAGRYSRRADRGQRHRVSIRQCGDTGRCSPNPIRQPAWLSRDNPGADSGHQGLFALSVPNDHPRGLQGRVDDRFFPFQAGSGLTASEVQKIIVQAAAQAFITRAAIRQPLNSAAEVNIAVVDTDGKVLGIFSTPDAPMFGFDVCVQKARTAALFSNASAAAQLRLAEGGFIARYVDAAASDGIRLDGSVAFSDRAQGFLSGPSFRMVSTKRSTGLFPFQLRISVRSTSACSWTFCGAT